MPWLNPAVTRWEAAPRSKRSSSSAGPLLPAGRHPAQPRRQLQVLPGGGPGHEAAHVGAVADDPLGRQGSWRRRTRRPAPDPRSAGSPRPGPAWWWTCRRRCGRAARSRAAGGDARGRRRGPLPPARSRTHRAAHLDRQRRDALRPRQRSIPGRAHTEHRATPSAGRCCVAAPADAQACARRRLRPVDVGAELHPLSPGSGHPRSARATSDAGGSKRVAVGRGELAGALDEAARAARRSRRGPRSRRCTAPRRRATAGSRCP